METWKELVYQDVPFLVSNLGNVRIAARVSTYSRTRNGVEQVVTKQIAEQTYTPQPHHTGYHSLELRHNGKRVRVLLHKLVALAHVEGFEEGLCVNHINGIKTDNRAVNLEWVSLARNTEHAWETGLVDLRGEAQPTHKLTSKQVVYIRKLLNQGIAAHTLAIIAGVDDVTIHYIKVGKRWAHIAA